MAIWNGTMPLRSPFIQLAPGQYHHPSLEINLEIISIIKCIECPPFQYESDLVELIVSPTNSLILLSPHTRSLSLSNVLIRSFGELISAPIFDIVESGLYLSGVTVSSLQSMAPIILASLQAKIEVNTCTFENITLRHNLTDSIVQPAVIVTGSQAQLFVTSTDFISNTLHVIEGSYGGVAIRSQGCYQIIDSRVINSSIIAEPHSNLNRTSLGGALLLSSEGIMSCSPSNLINRTEFTNNTIDSALIAGTGAAISLASNSIRGPSYIDSCTFKGNQASYGGAIGVIFNRQFSISTSMTLQNSSFNGNVAYRAGGAIHLWRATDWTIERCNFTDNILSIPPSTASFGGAAIALTQLLPASLQYPESTKPTFSARHRGPQQHASQFREAEQSSRLILLYCIFDENSLLRIGGTVESVVLTVLTTNSLIIDSCQFLNHLPSLVIPSLPLIRLNQIAHVVITRSQFIDNIYPVLVASNIKTALQTSTQIMSNLAIRTNKNFSHSHHTFDSDSAPSSAPSRKKTPFPIKATDFLYQKARLENLEPTICATSPPTIPLESDVNLVISNNLFSQEYKTEARAEIDLSHFGSVLFQSNNFTCENTSSITTSQPLEPLVNLDGSMSDAYFVENLFKSALPVREAIVAMGMDEVIISKSIFENAARFAWSSKIIVDSSNFSVAVGPATRLSFCQESCISRTTFTTCLSSFSGSAITSTGTETEIYASNFNGNQALYRGAIYSDSELRIFNSSFDTNRAGASGGAIWAGGRLFLFGSHFERNLADTGAAIVAADQAIILDCQFLNNRAFQQGGALWLGVGAEAVLDGTRFESNGAPSLGGAVYLGARSALYAYSSKFTRNYVTDAPNDENGESELPDPQSVASIITEGAGGSISAAQADVLAIEYCEFSFNRAHYGADVHMQSLPRVFVISGSNFSSPKCSGSGASIVLQPSLASSFFDESHLNSSDDGSQTLAYGLCKPWPRGHDWRIKHSKFEVSYVNYGYGGFILWIPCSNSSLHPAPIIDITDTQFLISTVKSGGVVLAAGPPHQFIRWHNITFFGNTAFSGGEVLFYNMVGSGPVQDPMATIQTVCTLYEGCVHSTIGSSLATSTGYRLNLTDLDDIRAPTAEITESRDEMMRQQTERLEEHSIFTATGSATPVWTADFRRLVFERVDLYNQTRLTDGKYSLNISMLTEDGSSFNPLFSFWTNDDLVNVELGSYSETRIDFNVTASLYRVPKLWNSKDRFKNRFDQFYPVQLSYEIPPTDPLYSRFWIPTKSFHFRIGACKIGSGLQKNPLFPNTYGCRECPSGTYNLNGDGQCYLCNDASTTEEKLHCGFGVIGSNQGWFYMRDSRDDLQKTVNPLASHMPSKGKSNKLWVYPCNPHYCGGNSFSMECDSYVNRTGLLCAHCSPGTSPSITSAKCSVCKGTWHSFGVLSLAILVATTIFMHVGLQRHFATTFFSFTFISISIMFPHQWLTENLPYAFYEFDWYCLGSTTPLNRAAIAAPVISAFSLPLSFVSVVLGVLLFRITRYTWHKAIGKVPKRSLLLKDSDDPNDSENEEFDALRANEIAKEDTPLLSATNISMLPSTASKANRKSISRYAPNITTWSAVLITTWLLIGLSLTPVLQTIIEFWTYIDSPLVDLWSVAPTVKITDHEFLSKRKLWMGLGIPYLIAALSFFFGMFLKPFKAFEILLLKEFETLKTAKIWIGLAMLLHLLTGILVSLAYWNLKTETIILPLVLLAFSCSFATFNPIREGHMAGFNVFGSFVLACFALLPLLNHAPSIGSQLQWDVTHFALTIFVWLIVVVVVLAPMSCLRKLRIA